MVLIDYRVPPIHQIAFAAAAADLRALRLRDGAYDWGLMADAAAPVVVTEWFLVGSWAEHLRQHDRVTVADRVVQDRVRAFHQGGEPPAVRHLVPVGASVPDAAHTHMATVRPD